MCHAYLHVRTGIPVPNTCPEDTDLPLKPSMQGWEHAEPTGQFDESLPSPARSESGGLVGVGARGLRGGQASRNTCPLVCRVRGLPLVPRDGPQTQDLARNCKTAGQRHYFGSCRFGEDRRLTQIPRLRVSLSCITFALGTTRGARPWAGECRSGLRDLAHDRQGAGADRAA